MVYNPVEDRIESHLITYPNFAVNQATKSMETCRSFSCILDFSDNEIIEKERSGLWLKLEPDIEEEDGGQINKRGARRSNEDEKVVDAADNPVKFIEQQCFFDLDDDGYEEPYIVTIYYPSKQVVRVVARYDESSLMVRMKESDAVLPLPQDHSLPADHQIRVHSRPGRYIS